MLRFLSLCSSLSNHHFWFDLSRAGWRDVRDPLGIMRGYHRAIGQWCPEPVPSSGSAVGCHWRRWRWLRNWLKVHKVSRTECDTCGFWSGISVYYTHVKCFLQNSSKNCKGTGPLFALSTAFAALGNSCLWHSLSSSHSFEILNSWSFV